MPDAFWDEGGRAVCTAGVIMSALAVYSSIALEESDMTASLVWSQCNPHSGGEHLCIADINSGLGTFN